MKICKTIKEIRDAVSLAKAAGKKIGFVPTMGALHAGHLSLIDAAKKDCDFVVVSIFVNPTQFAPSEDLESYPRDLSADSAKCQSRGVNCVFAPEVNEMYPKALTTWVDVEGELTQSLCGAARAGHFRGVATVCSKLFNIVLPDVAYFGQKDAQQAAVIRCMVDELNMPLEIEVCPIVREDSGLAMSSRNDYLSTSQRKDASVLYESLQDCKKNYLSGETQVATLVAQIERAVNRIGYAKINYVKIVDFDTLAPLAQVKNRALVAIAVQFGPARLIDNIILA